MGLSSSQARLLSLTGRMHDIEYKAQKLEAQKLQMANESTQVYKEYENALNKTKVQFNQMAADGSIDYVDATYNILMANNYKLSSSGKLVVAQEDIDYFNSAGGKDAMQFACLKSGFCVEKSGKIVLASDNNKVCIFTAEQLKTNANSTDTKVLMNDLTISEQITTLKGTLDGNGHTISVIGTNGLFSTLNNATVENLNLKGDINITNQNSGLLASSSLGTTSIKNINLSGKITSNSTSVSNIGGLIGYNGSGTLSINGVYSNVDITYSGVNNNSIAIGGIVGQSQTGKIEISNSIYNGNITSNNSTNTHIGGILGLGATNDQGSVTIEDCQSSGSINAGNNSNLNINTTGCGGIVGTVWSKSDTSRPKQNITNCISSMDINGGGVCTGGIIGYCQANTTNCSSSGTITSTSTRTGEIYGGNHSGFSHSNNNPQCNATGATTSIVYDPTTSPKFQHYYEIGKAIQSGEYVLVDGYEDDSNWLTNMINNAFIILAKLNPSTGKYDEVNVATDTSLQEVTDEVDLKKAEAKYEADMRKINQKDKKFDTDLAAMEAERNAIKTEMETLKSVARDNVDRTYKLFG